MPRSRVATSTARGEPYRAASTRARSRSPEMASVVTRAKPPTATQYVSGERETTRRRTDALLHEH